MYLGGLTPEKSGYLKSAWSVSHSELTVHVLLHLEKNIKDKDKHRA